MGLLIRPVLIQRIDTPLQLYSTEKTVSRLEDIGFRQCQSSYSKYADSKYHSSGRGRRQLPMPAKKGGQTIANGPIQQINYSAGNYRQDIRQYRSRGNRLRSGHKHCKADQRGFHHQQKEPDPILSSRRKKPCQQGQSKKQHCAAADRQENSHC